MKSNFAFLCVLGVLCGSPSFLEAQKVEVINNQPFPIRMPGRMLDGKQVMIDVAASGKQSIYGPGAARDMPLVSLERAENGLHLATINEDLGTLQWDVIVDPIDKRASDEDASKTKRDYDALFKAMPLTFTRAGNSNSIWKAEAEKSGLKLSIEVETYQDGFFDLRATVENESAPTTKVYAAVVTRWQRPAGATSTVDYDNHIAPLPPGGATRFRSNGEKHLFLQRGVDWINTSFEKASVAWLNDFSQSFTIHHEKTSKTPAQWRGGDAPQLGQEAALSGDSLYSITEIARPQIKYYQGRFTGDTLPLKGDPLHFTSLLAIDKNKLTDQRVDQMFVGYTSYNEEKKIGDTTQLSLGVPFVKFGTAYFPYSTLGENFEHWHMPGMSKESYWPLAADVVRNYKLFADDIKRDLRILKAMGFQTVRLHHLEMLYALEESDRDAFLDFYFGQLKDLGLTALIDVKLKPEQTAALVKKYREQIDGVEVDNELLIFGTNDNEVAGWKETYKQVKAVAPDLPVHFTGQTNSGEFDRLTKLGVPFDRIGLHSYCDSLDAIQSTRDFALAFSDYGSEIGKPPVITEWNWRFLTRMTPEDRAKVYSPIFENVFAAHSCPVFYQFQFQESLAMAPHTLRGIRHYDLLALSRRPRPEALEFVDLIHRYCDRSALPGALFTEHQTSDVPKDGGEIHSFVNVNSNATRRAGDEHPPAFKIKLIPESQPGIDVSIAGQSEFTITSGERISADLVVKLPADAPPGFYHAFTRVEDGSGQCVYAWNEIRKAGAPKFNKEKSYNPQVTYADGALDYDLNRDIAIVYPDGREKESRWDIESAWLIYQTLESATGRLVKIFQQKDLPPELAKSGNLIMVQMPHWNGATQPTKDAKSWITREPANQEHGDHLIINGNDEQSLSVAAEDFVLRYWQYAKDSGTRRIPLTDKPIDKGADVGARCLEEARKSERGMLNEEVGAESAAPFVLHSAFRVPHFLQKNEQ